MKDLDRTLAQLRERTRRLKSETYAIYLAYRDPRVSWFARGFAALVVGHALSPIDLIPDFIPVLGYLDDLVLVPAGIALAMRMIPEEVMVEARAKAEAAVDSGGPVSRLVAGVIVLVWMLLAAVVVWWLIRLLT